MPGTCGCRKVGGPAPGREGKQNLGISFGRLFTEQGSSHPRVGIRPPHPTLWDLWTVPKGSSSPRGRPEPGPSRSLAGARSGRPGKGRKQGSGVGGPEPLQAAGDCVSGAHIQSYLRSDRQPCRGTMGLCAAVLRAQALGAHKQSWDDRSSRRCQHASSAASPVGCQGGVGRRRVQPCRQMSGPALQGPAALWAPAKLLVPA